MINLIKKDMLVSYSNKTSNIMILMYFPLILFILGTRDINSIFIFSTFSFVFIITKIPFAYEVKDKPHVFIQSLPVTKKDIVISKYISIFVNLIVGIIYTFINMWIVSLIGIVNVDKISIVTILSTAGFTIVALSITLPMQFRFSPKTANFLNMFFYIMIINFIILSEDVFLKFLNLDFTNAYNILAIIAGIVAVYFISMAVSIALYKTRKFY